MRLRPDFPFRRLALVLSGGGAMGAYEIGVLRVLESLGVRPAVISGVSVGAINALLWVTNGFRTQPLVEIWSRLRPSGIGMRWATLAIRAGGMLLVTFALLEVILTLAGSPEVGALRWLRGGVAGRGDASSPVPDILAWITIGVLGGIAASLSRPVEGWIAGLAPASDPARWHRWVGRILLVAGLAHVLTLATGLPWPHRFSATALLVLAGVWLLNRSGRTGQWMRGLLIRLLPETGGRGLWGGAARRRLLERVADPAELHRLTDGSVRLIFSALAVDNGRICYFINWPDPSPALRRLADESLGEIQVLRDADEMLQAVVASSALPLVFEPVRLRGREFLDGGVFNDQPLRVVMGEEADAAIVVLLNPSRSLEGTPRVPNLFDLGSRLFEILNWRGLQGELQAIPADWSQRPPDGAPVKMCVVEPERTLPGGLLGVDPANAADLMRLGEADALRALARAGWLDEASPAPAPA